MEIFKNIKQKISDLFSGIEKNESDLSVSEQIEELDNVLENTKVTIADMQEQLAEHPDYDQNRNDFEYDQPSEDDDWFDL